MRFQFDPDLEAPPTLVKNRGRPADPARASLSEMRTRRRHGLAEFQRYRSGRKANGETRYRWACKRCTGEAVTRRKQKLKRTLIDEAGGRCAVCGYDRCVVNMTFHHVDPSQKTFEMSMRCGKGIDAFRAEAKKCVLVCANCHGEIEAGLIPSPPPGAHFPVK